MFTASLNINLINIIVGFFLPKLLKAIFFILTNYLNYNARASFCTQILVVRRVFLKFINAVTVLTKSVSYIVKTYINRTKLSVFSRRRSVLNSFANVLLDLTTYIESLSR